jgi:hypothetical protein
MTSSICVGLCVSCAMAVAYVPRSGVIVAEAQAGDLGTTGMMPSAAGSALAVLQARTAGVFGSSARIACLGVVHAAVSAASPTSEETSGELWRAVISARE